MKKCFLFFISFGLTMPVFALIKPQYNQYELPKRSVARRRDTLFRLIKEAKDPNDRINRFSVKAICGVGNMSQLDGVLTADDVIRWDAQPRNETACDTLLEMIRELYNYDYRFRVERGGY